MAITLETIDQEIKCDVNKRTNDTAKITTSPMH